MLANSIEINGCKHYFLNQKKESIVYFIHSRYFVEEDNDTLHPLGIVYKPKGCVDTLIRFVRQPNNETFLFKINEWNKSDNPFHKRGKNEPIRFTDEPIYKKIISKIRWYTIK